MSILKDVSIEAIRRMPENATVEDIVDEIYVIGDIIEESSEEGRMLTTEEFLNLALPEEEINEEERRETHVIREEMKKGKKFRFEDVLDELNV